MRPYQGPGYTNPGYYYPPYQGYPYSYQYPPQFPERKDTMVALLLAFFLPGAGHMYAEEVKKGILILAFFMAVVFLSILLWVQAISTVISNSDPASASLVAILTIVILLVIWLCQLYDAYQATVRFNANLDKNRTC
jgi:hypothetical protein